MPGHRDGPVCAAAGSVRNTWKNISRNANGTTALIPLPGIAHTKASPSNPIRNSGIGAATASASQKAATGADLCRRSDHRVN